ncbi:MAG: putative bifunctional diguanylate cyclase/phosphodiesterase [Bordetella sp.]|uniref:putative bifunctional diguanylate cyclase/phosphodiesterase n=1 Tax=Bordetella sp. TaxID=28081 RepID=UPI003F7CBE5D
MARTRISFLTKPVVFLLAGLCITLATTGVVAVALYQMRLDAMAQARDVAENLAISLEKEAERTLDIYQIAMRNVMTNLETPSPDLPPETRQFLAFNAADAVSDLGVIIATDSSGKVVLDSRSMQSSTIDVGRRDYFLVHRQTPDIGLYLSKPFMPITKSDYDSIAMSLRRADANGRFQGVVAGTLSLRYFRHLFDDSILGENGSLTLIRSDGIVLMRRPYKPDDIGKTLAGSRSFPPLMRSDHGTYIDVAALDHVERLYSFRKVGKYPLVVVAGLATRDIYAGWRKRALSIGAVTAILDALIIMLCLMFSAQLQRRLATERQLQKLAWFDTLTSLPNRRRINREAHRILADARRYSSQVAVLFVDLDRFKRINDTQGHAIGDEVLSEVAQRLRRCVQGKDLIGRLGGDEFVAVLERCDVHKAARVADRIMEAMQRPIAVNTGRGVGIALGVSIGIALYPHDGRSVDTLLRNADMAMYRAKNAGRNQMHFYASEYEHEAREHLDLEIALQRALREGALQVAYQPKVGAWGMVHGVEALARWHDDKLGTVAPDRFIAVAEESGLITELDTWILEQACSQLAAWRAAGLDIPTVSVNVCAADFKRPDFADFVARTLQAHNLRPSDLTLEMTERVMFDESTDDIRATLESLHAQGITLSIDDFGTGYSSLSYLHRFPVQELKIDKSFVQGIGTSAMAESLTQTVVNIGHALKLTIVAEGVETLAQRDFLSRHGCLIYQGYLYSPPLAPQDFARWAEARKPS